MAGLGHARGRGRQGWCRACLEVEAGLDSGSSGWGCGGGGGGGGGVGMKMNDPPPPPYPPPFSFYKVEMGSRRAKRPLSLQ